MYSMVELPKVGFLTQARLVWNQPDEFFAKRSRQAGVSKLLQKNAHPGWRNTDWHRLSPSPIGALDRHEPCRRSHALSMHKPVNLHRYRRPFQVSTSRGGAPSLRPQPSSSSDALVSRTKDICMHRQPLYRDSDAEAICLKCIELREACKILPPFQISKHRKNFGESKQSQIWLKL